MKQGLVLAGLLMALPMAQAGARECASDLGHGWPPAVGNYGQAVESLFDGTVQPALSLVSLPRSGVETGVALLPAPQDQAWTLRYSRADKRVYTWNSGARQGGVELRVDQEPDQYQVSIPALLAQRLLHSWQAALAAQVPGDRKAPVLEGDVLSFTVDGQRYSGTRPACGAGRLMMKQVALLIEASDTKEKKLDRRWKDLDESLDELQQLLAGTAG